MRAAWYETEGPEAHEAVEDHSTGGRIVLNLTGGAL